MPFVALALSMLLLFMGASVRLDGQAQAVEQASHEAISGAVLRVTATIAGAYMRANPSANGELSASDLATYKPEWFQIPAQVQVVANAGRAFVVLPAGFAPPLDSIFSASDLPSANLGTVMGGKLVSPSYPEGLDYTLPASIHEGSFVYVV
ncbi:hypothetical protein CDEF62S_00027 [Castellaniella defragrans]